MSERIVAIATCVGVAAALITAIAFAWWLEDRWQARYLAALDARVKRHQEEIRLNNELMIQESLLCAKSGGIPVRVDVMNAAPRIHCARR